MAGSWREPILLAASCFAAASASAAIAFSSSEDDFLALFPAYPHVESSTIEIADAHHCTMRTYRVDEGNVLWLISATDITGLGLDTARALAATRSGLVKSSGGALASEQAVKIGRYDGVELRLRRPDHLVLHARICVTGRRIYEALVVTNESEQQLSRIERFLQASIPG